MNNPLKGWQVDPAAITTTGVDLRRPECVLAEPSGDLWIADLRGGVMHIRPDGTQRLITPKGGGGPFAPEEPNIDGNGGFSMPNGLCFDATGDIIIANFGTNLVEKITREGDYQLILSEVDGRPIGKANFPAFDREGRLWFTVTASQEAWRNRTAAVESDGYIVVLDEKGPRIVAEGFAGTNEFRFDETETWAYVAETGGDHMTRLKIGPGGTVIGREVYGPARLGGGPDGFAFDSHGNLWTTLIGANRLVAITPDGELLTVWEDGDPEAKRSFGGTGGSLMISGAGMMAPRMASITFGGPDLCTVYIGSLMGSTLPTFRAPLPGRALPHWSKMP